jgi:maleate isomerase
MTYRLGMLTPSSNTVLEPETYALLTGAPGLATAHFGRFRVTEIALDNAALGQFEAAPILAAASLLADAKVDVIAWNGTSASWLGLDRDRDLVARIEAGTGVKATTCVLGLFDLIRSQGARTLGLVTPYTADVQARIAERYAAEGVIVTTERHMGYRDNFSFATVGEDDIERMIREVAVERPDAIAIVCTNMRGGRLVPALEVELGVPIYDSVAVTLRAALDRIGASPAPLAAAGRVFQSPRS